MTDRIGRSTERIHSHTRIYSAHPYAQPHLMSEPDVAHASMYERQKGAHIEKHRVRPKTRKVAENTGVK